MGLNRFVHSKSILLEDAISDTFPFDISQACNYIFRVADRQGIMQTHHMKKITVI